MSNTIFVAPFFMTTTNRFIHAAATVPGARMGLVSQDPVAKAPPEIRDALAAHVQVEDALDPDRIEAGVRRLAGELGSVDRLLGTLEELQVPLGTVRDRLGIHGLGETEANNFRDKSRMKDVLRAAGLPCARHGLVTDLSHADDVAAEVGFPMIVKPPAGSGARRTFRVEDPAQLAQALRTMPPSAETPALLEEFVFGEEHSFDSIVRGGRVVWHSINHYFPSPLEVLQQPWIQWAVLLPREVDSPRYEEIRRVAGEALAALGLDEGLSHMEWFRRPDGSVAISEVGARPPGAQFTSLISWAHDFDLYRAWAELMTHGAFEPRPRPYAAGAAYLRGQGRGRVKAVHGLQKLRDELGPIIVDARLPQPGQPPSGTYEGEGYVIVRHPETAMVEDALRKIITGIRVELEA